MKKQTIRSRLEFVTVQVMLGALAASPLTARADCHSMPDGSAATEAYRQTCEQQQAARGKLLQTRDGTIAATSLIALDLTCSFIPFCAPASGYTAAVTDKGDDARRVAVADQAADQMAGMAQSWITQIGGASFDGTVGDTLFGTTDVVMKKSVDKATGAVSETPVEKDVSGILRYNQKDMFLALVKKGFQIYGDQKGVNSNEDDKNNNNNNSSNTTTTTNYSNGPQNITNRQDREDHAGGDTSFSQERAVSAMANNLGGGCAGAKKVSDLLNCQSSNGATLSNLMKDKKAYDAFKARTGKDPGEFVDAAARALGENPRNLANLIAGATGNQDVGNRVAAALDAFGAGKSPDDGSSGEGGQKYAASNLSGTYKGGGQPQGGAKGAEGALAASLNGLFNNLLGDPAKKLGDASAKGKVSLLNGRRSKLAGFGEDAWKNRLVSIFERVEAAYEDQISKNNWSLNDWTLAGNAANHRDLRRAPASVPGVPNTR